MRELIASALAAVTLVALAAPAFGQAGGLTALPPTENGPNAVANPGFEAATAGAAGVVEGWRVALDGNLWSLAEGKTGRAGLRMSGAAAASRIPAAEQVVALEPGYYTIEGWVKTDKLGGAADRFGARLCLDGRPRINWWHCTPVARGTTAWTRLVRAAIPVEDRGAYRVTVGAYGRPEGTAWFDDVAVTKLARPRLETFLLYPNYRGMLFDDRSQTVRVAFTINDAAPADARVRLSIVDEASGTVRAHREYPASSAAACAKAPSGSCTRGGWVVGELDAAPLDHGEYLVRAELISGAAQELARHPEYRVIKASARARDKLRVFYDEANVAHLDGKPSFVLGLYTTGGYSPNPAAYANGRDGWGTARMAQAPINMLINYWLGAAPMPALSALMDDLRGRGIHYLQTVNFYYEDHPEYAKIPYPAARDGQDALNRWVATTLARHPALAGFYTADERPAEMVPKVFRQHRELRRAAPGTVNYAVLGDGWERQAPLWRDSADVIGLDPYPLTKAPGQNNLAMVGDWTRLGQDAVMRSRPLWMVLQYFPQTAVSGWPTRDELRAMSWMAIVEGARGLLYWSFGAKGLAWVKDPAEREQRWEDLVTVTKEIKALEPVLLAPDAPVVTRDSSGGAVRSLGKRLPSGERYLFAYNTTRAPVAVAFTLAEGARDVQELGPAGERATPPTLAGTTLSDRLGPYEIRRYRIE